jgi:general secretion pathway protein D
VLIEVTIAEVQRNRDLDVGISGKGTHTKRGQSKPDATATMPSTASARDFVAELAGGHGTIDYNVALNALASRGELRVLSLPIIIAQNNKEATLNVGSSRPFVQISQAPGNDPNGRVETVNYIDVGTTLTITPTINVDGYVNLLVKQTANSATNEIQFDAPVISKREATTQVFVKNGQTTVIGGLADKSRERTRSGIPLLSDIPLLGFLFSNTEEHDVTNELYLFLTPHVISGDADVDRLRNAVKQGSILLKQVPITPLVPSDSVGPAPRDSVPAPRDSVPAPGDSIPDARHGGAPAMRPGSVRP